MKSVGGLYKSKNGIELDYFYFLNYLLNVTY